MLHASRHVPHSTRRARATVHTRTGDPARVDQPARDGARALLTPLAVAMVATASALLQTFAAPDVDDMSGTAAAAAPRQAPAGDACAAPRQWSCHGHRSGRTS